MPETPKPTKAARVLDPDIARLREAHAQNVLNLKKTRASSAILALIVEKRIPKMTDDDIAKLLAAIGPKPVPVPLVPRPAPAAPALRPIQLVPGPVPPRKP